MKRKSVQYVVLFRICTTLPCYKGVLLSPLHTVRRRTATVARCLFVFCLVLEKPVTFRRTIKIQRRAEVVLMSWDGAAAAAAADAVQS